MKLAHLNELGLSILNNIEKGFELNKFKNKIYSNMIQLFYVFDKKYFRFL